jgi:hypothetical protein
MGKCEVENVSQESRQLSNIYGVSLFEYSVVMLYKSTFLY